MKCPACDAEASEGAAFCSRCGARMPGVAAAPERRVVTALFCDLVDSTELGGRTDPEELDELRRRYYGLARKEIERRGGTVEKFIGDAVAGLFGYPLAHEDDPERAVRAAVEIVEKIRASGLDLAVRVGVETGDAFVREDVAPGQGAAIGDVMNTASRLQGAAEPMSVVVGPRARASTARSFEFSKLPPLRLKGKDAPVQAWRALGAVVPSAEVGDGAPFVGRERELGELRSAMAALRERTGGVLVVEGEPGIGKSRLVRQVRESSSVLWLRGRSVETRDAAGYRPFAEQIRTWAGPTPASWDTLVWRTLALGLGRKDAGFLAAISEIEPDAATAQRLSLLDPESLRPSVYRSVRGWLDALAAVRPVVLEFEDWHWADRASVQLLEHVLPLAETRPLLILVVTRPTRARPADDDPATEGRSRRLSLAPLADEDARLLLDRLVSGQAVPRDRLRSALARAEGNPYFLNELSRFITEEERAGELPDNVRAVVTSRVDRLSPELRSLLRVAAVIGRFFSTELLQRLDVSDEAADELETLVSTGLIVPTAAGRYQFAHALTRETVYEGVPLAERRRVHKAIADALADEAGQAAFLPAIAYHLAQAEDWDAAVSALVAAGEHAARLASDDEALDMYRAAIHAHERLPAERWGPIERSRIDREVADALRRLGRHEEATTQIVAALSRLGVRLPEGKTAVKRAAARQLLRRMVGPPRLPAPEATPDPMQVEIDRELEVLGWIAYFEDFDRVAHVDLMLATRAARARDLEGVVVGTFRGALAFAALGRKRLAWRYARRALEAAGRLDDPVQVARAKQGISIVALQLSGWEQTIDLLQPTLDRCAEAGELRLWGASAALLAFAAVQRGDLDLARELATEMQRAGSEGGNRQIHGWGLMTAAGSSLHEGDSETAARVAQDAVDVLARVPDHLIGVVALGVLARAQVRLDQTDAAAATIERGSRDVETRALRGIFVSQIVEAEAELALLELARGRSRAADASSRRANRSSLRHAHIGRWHAVHAHMLDGGRAWLLGKERPADRAFARARALADEHGWHGALRDSSEWVDRCCAEAGLEPPPSVVAPGEAGVAALR